MYSEVVIPESLWLSSSSSLPKQQSSSNGSVTNSIWSYLFPKLMPRISACGSPQWSTPHWQFLPRQWKPKPWLNDGPSSDLSARRNAAQIILLGSQDQSIHIDMCRREDGYINHNTTINLNCRQSTRHDVQGARAYTINADIKNRDTL